MIKAIHRAIEGINLITRDQKRRVKQWRENKAQERLTEREREILSLMQRGFSNEAIAKELGITYRTTAFHITNLLRKLGMSSRQEVIAWAFENLGDDLQTG